MKKYLSIIIAFGVIVALVLFIITVINNSAIGQSPMKSSPEGKPIPQEVVKIAEKACMPCHAEPGNMMAKSHVNLSKWDSYSPEKQASKAQDMCKMVTKEKMPPKKFRESHPDAVPTAENIKTICDWAASLEMPKK